MNSFLKIFFILTLIAILISACEENLVTHDCDTFKVVHEGLEVEAAFEFRKNEFTIFGVTGLYGHGIDKDVFAGRLNSCGDLEWISIINAGLNNISAVQLSNGNLLLSWPHSSGKSFILFMDSRGNEIERVRYSGINIYKMLYRSSGDIFLSGDLWKSEDQKNDLFLMKINSYGDSLWSKTYGGSENEYFSNSVMVEKETITIIGRTSAHELLRVDSDMSGGTVSSFVFTDRPASHVIPLSDGGLAICNNFPNGTKNQYDFKLVFVDGDDNTIFSKTYGDEGNELVMAFSQTGDGNFIIGSLWSPPYGYYNTVPIKVDPDGNEIWKKSFGKGGLETMIGTEEGLFMVIKNKFYKLDQNGDFEENNELR